MAALIGSPVLYCTIAGEVAEDEAVNALVSADAAEVAEMAGSRIVVPVVFVGAAAEVVAEGLTIEVSVEAAGEE